MSDDCLKRSYAARCDAGSASCHAAPATATRLCRLAVLQRDLHLLDAGDGEILHQTCSQKRLDMCPDPAFGTEYRLQRPMEQRGGGQAHLTRP
jgi:hypothetical protein